MTPEEALHLIQQLAPIAQKQGIKRVKVGDLEVEFGGSGEADEKLLDKFYDKFMGEFPSGEELLTHSAPGGPLSLEDLRTQAEASRAPFTRAPRTKKGLQNLTTSEAPKHKV